MRPIKTLACMLLLGTATNALAALFAAPGNTPEQARDTNLYILDPATGAVLQTIGPTGFPITGLDFHPQTGELWATSAYDNFDAVPGGDEPDPDRGWLLRIDPATGNATPIAQHDDCAIIDISFAADGTLYGWRECDDILVTIDLATAQTTEIGPDTGTARQGMDFANDGRLYAFGNLPWSGQSCKVIEMDPDVGGLIGDQVDLVPCEVINAGTHDDQGTLWISVVEETGEPGRELATLNLATGVISTVGPTVNYLSALAWGDAVPARPVPALDLRALIILGAAVMLIGGFLARRRVSS